MNIVTQNILKEITSIPKEIFTKTEILALINECYNRNDLPSVESNGVVVNPQTVMVTYNGNDYTIPKKEFELLYFLVSNKNKLMTRQKILNDVWGADICVGERTIDVHIRRIRQLLSCSFIKTNKGVGYRWVEN